MAVRSDRFLSTTGELWQLGNTFGLTASQNNGNITSQTVNAGGPAYSTSYGYDVLNRLLTATESGGWVQEHCYDAVGNRAQKSGTALFSAANLVPTSTCTGAFTVPYSDRYQWNAAGHDPAGNQTTLAGRTYTFDTEGRITTATGLPVNSLVAFDYDGAGRRVRKTVGSSVTISVYDAMGNLAAEYENQPAVPPCATCYFSTDHLGSTRVVTDAAGNVVRRYDHAPFGEEIPAGTNGRAGAYRTSQGMTIPDALKEEFTGKERDTETGLDYFGARYFSGAQGRFTSPDPVKVTPERMRDPQQFNLYAYVRNNPLRYIDPTGEVLQLSGDVNEAQKQLCEILGTGDCAQRISYNAETNTITVDLAGIELGKNEGAQLLDNLVGSTNVYNLTLDSQFMTAGGLRSLTAGSPIANLDNFDTRLGRPTLFDRPPKGVDDIVAINPAHARSLDTKGRRVSLSALIFHELAEAYAKVDLGKQYSSSDVQDVQGGMIVIRPGAFEGAHQNAVSREIKLREQRPNIQTGRAGDSLIRDPKP